MRPVPLEFEADGFGEFYDIHRIAGQKFPVRRREGPADGLEVVPFLVTGDRGRVPVVKAQRYHPKILSRRDQVHLAEYVVKAVQEQGADMHAMQVDRSDDRGLVDGLFKVHPVAVLIDKRSIVRKILPELFIQRNVRARDRGPVAECGVHRKYQGEQNIEQSIHVQLLITSKQRSICIGLSSGKKYALSISKSVEMSRKH